MAQVEIIAANLKTNVKNSIKKIIKRVCAYCRVSTDSEEQQTSYNSQIKYYTDKIKSNPDWEFGGIYADEGISGTQVKKRTEFMRMIEDAMNGKIDIIIAKSISRFARNTLDTLKYVRLLREHNVDVYFEKENIHTLELDSEMFLTLYSAFAQAESESISQNVKMGVRAKMKRGEFISLANPYGYDWDKATKTISINEEQAEVVRRIFNWYISGDGSLIIANKLNEMNIPSPKDKKWIPSTVRNILRNEKYVGDLMSGKSYSLDPISHKRIVNFGERERYYTKDHHIAIISRDVWNKTQEIYNKRSNHFLPDGKSHNNKYSTRYAFSSKIQCGICGNNYVRRKNEKRKDGTCKIYWACSRRINYNYCKDSIFITEDNLKEMFIQIFNSIIEKKHKTRDKLLNAIRETLNNDDTKNKIIKLNSEKEILEKRLSNLIDMKLDDYDNRDAYVSKEKEINEQLKKITIQIKEYEKITINNKNVSKQLEMVEKILDTKKTINDFDREIFDNLVEKIIVGVKDDDGNIIPNVVNFVLKVGTEYKYEITGNEIVSSGTNKLAGYCKRQHQLVVREQLWQHGLQRRLVGFSARCSSKI